MTSKSKTKHTHTIRLFLAGIFLLLNLNLPEIKAQEQAFTRIITGRVTDAETGAPLSGAGIMVLSANSPFGVTTDSLGFFQMKKVPFGFHELRIHSMGYNTVWLPVIQVTSGTLPFIAISLRKRMIIHDNLIVPGYRKNHPDAIMRNGNASRISYSRCTDGAAPLDNPLHAVHQFGNSAPRQVPGQFLCMQAASPNFTNYQVEQMPMPAISHLSGIYNPAGAISFIPANRVERITMHSGAPPASSATTQPGLVDITLQEGNYNHPQFGVQLGTHVSGVHYSGPVIRNKASVTGSYRQGMAHYLKDMQLSGFPGNQPPTWQDGLLKASAVFNDGSKLKLTAIGAKAAITSSKESPNWFYAQPDTLYDKLFHTTTHGGAGLQFSKPISGNMQLNASLNALYSQTYINGADINSSNQRIPKFAQQFTRNRYNLKATYRYIQDKQNVLATGLNLHYNRIQLNDSLGIKGSPQLRVREKIQGEVANIQLFGEWQHRFNNALKLYAGLNMQYVPISEDFSVAPHAWVNWEINKKHSLILSLSSRHWMYEKVNYFHKAEYLPEMYTRFNRNLPNAQTTHASLTYDLLFHSNLQLRAKGWFRFTEKLPVPKWPADYAPFLNPWNSRYHTFDSLYAKGTMQSQGVTISFEHFGSTRFHYRIAASWNHSVFYAYDERRQDNPLGNQINLRTTAGYKNQFGQQWQWQIHLGSELFTNPAPISRDAGLQAITGTPGVRYNTDAENLKKFYVLLNADTRLTYNQPKVSHQLMLEIHHFHFDEIPGLHPLPSANASFPRFYPALTYKLEF